jgi:hypothetical protein
MKTNKKVTIKKICKCGSVFTVERTVENKKSKKERKCCSRKCANSRQWSEDDKNLKSLTANPWNRGKRIYKYCKNCGKTISQSKSGLCKECYLKSLPETIVKNGRTFIKTPLGYEGKTYNNGKYILQSRYRIEQNLGRYLTRKEVVHHKDGNKLNDSIENLEVLLLRDHSKLHSKKGRSYVELTCPICYKQFKIEIYRHKNKLKAGQELFFCSRSCSGKHTRSIQINSGKK